MKIGELAQSIGISERMLRYYEQEGLLIPSRTKSGYRLYGAKEIKTAQRIRILNDAGLKLETIRMILPCMMGEKDVFEPCKEVKKTLQRQLAMIDEELQRMNTNREILSQYLLKLITKEKHANDA